MPTDPQPHPGDLRRALLWVAILAAILRLLYFTEHAGSPFFGIPVLDEKYYDSMARALAAGDDVDHLAPGFRPLLYPALLAGIYRVFGDWGMVAAGALQHLLGVMTTVLVGLTAARLFRSLGAALAASATYVLAGPPLYFEGELLITSLFTFLCCLCLAWMVASEGRASPKIWLAAGALIALAAQARPNALALLGVFPLVAVSHRIQARRTFRQWAWALAGCLAVLVLAALLQQRWVGHFQLLPGAGGVNLYLGNKVGADGMVPRQDRAVTYGEEYRDSVQVFAREAFLEEQGRSAEGATPGAVSRYWIGRTLEEVRQAPAAWLALMARKAGLMIWSHEVPNNKSYGFIRQEESRLLGLLPIHWWWLFALAPMGLLAAWRQGPERRGALLFLLATAVLLAATVILFFVNSRYRLPLWPPMAILAGGGLMGMIDAARSRSWRSLGVALATSVLLALLSLGNWTRAEPPGFERDFFFRSIAWLERGEAERALEDADHSLELRFDDAATHFQRGSSLMALGRVREALESFRRAVDLAPGEPRAVTSQGVAHEELEEIALAYASYRRALELAPDYPPALVRAALIELRARRVDLAGDRLLRAEALGHRSLLLICGKAMVEALHGNHGSTRALIEEAMARDPEGTRQLLKRLETPVDLGL